MNNEKSIFVILSSLPFKSSLLLIHLLLITKPSFNQNFTTNGNNARLYGIHEITLTGTSLPVASKRYSKFPNVRFVNGGTTFNVMAFYDGNGSGRKGSFWKARLYITKEGPWSWSVTDNDGIRLKGAPGGKFYASDTNFALEGKLRQHTNNANRWATERDTDTAFLALGDTQYTLMDKVWTSEPDSSRGSAGDWDAVIDDSFKKGITLIRAGAFGGYSQWNGRETVGPKKYPRPNWPWADDAAAGNKDVYDLTQMVATDTRLIYSINKYEDLYFELIISPKTKMWGRYWQHSTYGCTSTQIENFRKYMTARLSAYPNVIFQLIYDIDFKDIGGGCGADLRGYGDENYAFAQDWLEWLRDNDPFNTMRCIGNGNDYNDPFPERYYNQNDPPPTYIHDEAIGDISGKTAEKYYGKKNTPIFHGEDSYEVDVLWGAGTSPSDYNPEYYYRRIFWADLLSGAYPCYGGGYKAIIPYNDAYDNVNYYLDTEIICVKLRGLDDVIHIKNFFIDNNLDIADFHPADSLAINGPSSPGQIQIAYNAPEDEFIIYHPNSTVGEADYDPNDLCKNYTDSLISHFACNLSDLIPFVTLRLCNDKTYFAKWFDPSTGIYYNQRDVSGGNMNYTFIAPSDLKGKDAILLLKAVSRNDRIAIIAHRGGRSWAPENTLAAYKKCAKNNLDWETDLGLTSDGEIILMHDLTLDRTTDARAVFGGSKIEANSKTLAQIRTLDAGTHFNSEYTGEKVPTLDEFLDCFVAIAPGNTVISMDLKLSKLTPDSDVYQRMINKIAARDLFERIFIEVSAVEAVKYTRNLKNGDKLKYAIWVNRDTTLLNNAISSGYFSRIHASNMIANKADDVHAGGVPFISAHPVESLEDWNYVKNYRINGVSTDKPDVTLFILKNEIPTCSIKIPVNGSIFNKGETITIEINAEDTDSSITRVEFYRNGWLIGQDTSSPYSYLWTDAAEGNYTLTTKVFDNGMFKISEPIIIHVK
jgi:glycerophosphoryl diester phosphodiesterase